jgi:hypothetical protein
MAVNTYRDKGKPRNYTTDNRCKAKPRYTDELQARAAATVRLDEKPQLVRLWIYRCKHCFGWHLTSKSQGARFAVERILQAA